MRSITRVGLTLLLALPLLASMTATTASPNAPWMTRSAGRSAKLPWQAGSARFVPNEVVVVAKASASHADVRALAARVGVRVVPTASGGGVDVVRLPEGRSVDAAIRRLERSPLVRFAEPNRIATLTALPDDSYFSDQWALENTHQLHEVSDQGGGSGTRRRGTTDADIDAPAAWAVTTGSSDAIVAVLDTGVDVDHPDLANSLWVNTTEQAGTPGVDDDTNGFIDDVNGWDFTGVGDPNPSPATGGGAAVKLDNAHGTHVAGIVAAEQNNTEGISGVCPDCSIMALRIGSASGVTLGAELQAIDYAIANHADVINLSIGTPVWSKAERSAFKRAGNHGILVVVSAGNSSLDNDIPFTHASGGTLDAWAPSFPASYTLPNVLAVAASNDRDQYGEYSQCLSLGFKLWQCGFTSWGHDSVDLAAPGVDIKSTVTVGVSPGADPDYDVWDGTSMAAPIVAGIAGLVRSEHAAYTPTQVKNAIMNSVDHPGLTLYTSWADVTHVGRTALSGRFTRTNGRVNASKALTASTANATPASDGNIDGAKAIVKTKLGHVAWPADANDVYKKRLAKGAKYNVVLDGPKGSDMDLWVWNPGTAEIYQFTAGCFQGLTCPALRAVSAGKTADEKVTFTAKKPGVYYFLVNGWYRGGTYRLTVKRV